MFLLSNRDPKSFDHRGIAGEGPGATMHEKTIPVDQSVEKNGATRSARPGLPGRRLMSPRKTQQLMVENLGCLRIPQLSQLFPQGLAGLARARQSSCGLELS